MAYKIPRNWSLESARTYVVQVMAGLKAMQLEALVEPWRQMKNAVLEARDARDAARDAEAESTARVRVSDSQWDEAVQELSSVSHLLSKKNVRQPPYSELFGTVKAGALKSLGPAKASVAGRTLSAKAMAFGDSQLSALASTLAARTEALSQAEAADADAEIALLTHSVARLQLLQKMERLGAETEAALLQKYPGRRDLVRAILDTLVEKHASAPALEASPEEEEVIDPVI